jgi:transcription antitermination factor NusB
MFTATKKQRIYQSGILLVSAKTVDAILFFDKPRTNCKKPRGRAEILYAEQACPADAPAEPFVLCGGKRMTRREAREQALCIIFERMFNDETIKEILSLAKDAREFEPDAFAVQLAHGVCDHIDELDAGIEKYSIGWSKGRLSKVVYSILRMALYEIDYIPGIPVSVTINEAVDLAKKYGGDGDSAFVNGLLGTFVRSGDAKKSLNDLPRQDSDEGSARVKK